MLPRIYKLILKFSRLDFTIGSPASCAAENKRAMQRCVVETQPSTHTGPSWALVGPRRLSGLKPRPLTPQQRGTNPSLREPRTSLGGTLRALGYICYLESDFETCRRSHQVRTCPSSNRLQPRDEAPSINHPTSI